MSGALVISLDFELMWGVRDHRTVQDYGDAVLGGRKAIPRMLKLFEAYGIRATWATVGLLFARSRTEMLDYAPKLKPSYRNMRLSPYEAITKEIGPDETADPYHYGRSLVDRILDTPGQELATHTFAHYYCLEDGQTAQEFEADIQAAQDIARAVNVMLRSIVFPRNQSSPDAIRVCDGSGLRCYRGNPETYLDKPRKSGDQSLLLRGLRTADTLMPLTASNCHPWPDAATGIVNVPASRFFCPVTSRLPLTRELLARRIEGEMTHAAKNGLIYHLWWHPHNFGRQVEQSLTRLETVLGFYRRLADRYGMKSMAMGDFLPPAPLLKAREMTGIRT